MLYRNRVYHPTLGRFLQRDPIGYRARDVNLVRYVGNQSHDHTDAFGHQNTTSQTPFQVSAHYAIRYGRATTLAEKEAIARDMIEMLKLLHGISITLPQALEALDNRSGSKTASPPVTLNSPRADTVTDISGIAEAAALAGAAAIASAASAACDARKIKCEELYRKYKYNPDGSQLICPSCRSLTTIPACIASLICFSMVAGLKAKYLELECDYFLEGSIQLGSEGQEAGHVESLWNTLRAISICSERIALLGIIRLI